MLLERESMPPCPPGFDFMVIQKGLMGVVMNINFQLFIFTSKRVTRFLFIVCLFVLLLMKKNFSLKCNPVYITELHRTQSREGHHRT